MISFALIVSKEYLINLTKKGMYYYIEDNFIIENIDNFISDFKVSISIDKIKEFLTEILSV